MSAKQNAPVVIKRKKVTGGDGHHGGAWKMAYADFVTAMMAFFMLMWLLNATTETQRKGIADYFNPTIPVNRISGGGDGAFGGDSVFTEESLARNGSGASAANPLERNRASGTDGANETAPGLTPEMAEVERRLTATSGESMVSNQAMRHITTRVTDEGLIVELFDLDDAPLFDAQGAPMPVLRELTTVVARVFGLATNKVAVSGYLRAHPVVLRQNPVWPASVARAATVRELLFGAGLAPGRVERVAGYADRKPAVRNPTAARNNRVEIVLLRDPPKPIYQPARRPPPAPEAEPAEAEPHGAEAHGAPAGHGAAPAAGGH